jgi:hypothetical protein
MRIPKHWAKSASTIEKSGGDIRRFVMWRWSDTSVSEAQQAAADALQQTILRFQNDQQLGRYSYGRNPLREEIIQSIKNADGNEIGIITRNGYGALVLNSAQAMFIDIDFPEKSAQEILAGGIGKLFGKKPVPSPELTYLQNIEQWSKRNPSLGLRIYRTFGGLRCLITNEVFDPTQPSSLDLMRGFQSDPLYLTLCKQQESFRARLTPKPWRCGADQPPSRYPWGDIQQEQRYRQWENTYNQKSALFTTCRLVKELGPAETHPDVEPILRLHDERSCAVDSRNLA